MHIEDSPDDAELIARELRKVYTIAHKVVSTGPELIAALQQHWDIVLSDFSMPGFSGLEALEIIKQKAPALPFVFVSGTIGEERAVIAIKSGATDFVIKDSLKRLIPVVERVLKEAELQRKFREAEANLQKSQALYQLLAENSSDIIAVMGEDYLVKYVSPAIESITGYKPQDLLGTIGLRLMHPQDAGFIQDTLAAALKNETPFQISFCVRRKDGAEIWLEALGKIITDANTLEKNILTVTRDITERRKAEARVREQATLLDIARDAIIVRDLQHRILYWNKGAERIYGWTNQEALSRSVQELTYTQTEIFDEAWTRLLADGEFSDELTQVTKDNRKIIVHARWTLVYDDAGNPKSVLCINSDMTERKKLEQQFLRAQRLESIGTLAGGIAHDLNNMLTPIILAIEILRTEELSKNQEELVSTIELSARRGADMVKQVLSFGRGAEGNPKMMLLEILIRDLGKIIYDTFPKNIRLELSSPPDLWPVKGDATQIHQVLLNLAVNARDAMPQGGILKISAENKNIDAQLAEMSGEMIPGKYVAICVEDSGTGMPPQVQEKIFEPFFTTKEVGRGTGLGLSTSLAIVKSHRGFVKVYSEPGKGTRFHIFIPVFSGAEVQPQIPQLGDDLPRGQGELILVVDDEKPIREMTRKTLESFGYTVKTAADGIEGIGIFTQFKDVISLVITDIMMPVLDGSAMIQVIRKIAPLMPIIAASGLDTNGKSQQLTVAGVNFFLLKPYGSDTLLETIRQALVKPGQ